MEAFAWILFALCRLSPVNLDFVARINDTPALHLPVVIFLWILITLTSRAQVLGRPYAWSEPIFELPWFGQYPGMPESMYGPHIPGSPGGGGSPYMGGGYAYPAASPGMYPNMMPGGGQQPYMMNGGYVVPQQPGHSVIVQPGARGQPPTITQVPGMVTAA